MLDKKSTCDSKIQKSEKLIMKYIFRAQTSTDSVWFSLLVPVIGWHRKTRKSFHDKGADFPSILEDTNFSHFKAEKYEPWAIWHSVTPSAGEIALSE